MTSSLLKDYEEEFNIYLKLRVRLVGAVSFENVVFWFSSLEASELPANKKTAKTKITSCSFLSIYC